MKALGNAFTTLCERYPAGVLVLGVVALCVASNIAYNACVLIDRHNQYKELGRVYQ